MKWMHEQHTIIRRWACPSQLVTKESGHGNHLMVRGWSCHGNRVVKHWSQDRPGPHITWCNGHENGQMP